MILGVTGGIGSGKSTVCSVFNIMGVPVYDSDFRARLLTDGNSDVKNRVVALFGNDVYTVRGLDRKKVGEMVFQQPELLAKLNAIIHPVVADDFLKWKLEHSNNSLLIKEAAILFESGAYKAVDKTLLIVAPVELRINRVMKRDSISREHVLNRISNQWDDRTKLKLSDFVIYCDEKQSVIKQVLDFCELNGYNKVLNRV